MTPPHHQLSILAGANGYTALLAARVEHSGRSTAPLDPRAPTGQLAYSPITQVYGVSHHAPANPLYVGNLMFKPTRTRGDASHTTPCRREVRGESARRKSIGDRKRNAWPVASDEVPFNFAAPFNATVLRDIINSYRRGLLHLPRRRDGLRSVLSSLVYERGGD